jgi:hypothetical protein
MKWYKTEITRHRDGRFTTEVVEQEADEEVFPDEPGWAGTKEASLFLAAEFLRGRARDAYDGIGQIQDALSVIREDMKKHKNN